MKALVVGNRPLKSNVIEMAKDTFVIAADAGADYHEHQFHELPGLTFYMPADQGYHGATNSSGQTKFKTKSHF